MAVSDINSYALSVEFALQDKATPMLDTIDQRFEKIEQQVTQLATKSMSGVQTITTEINKSLLSMSAQYEKINVVAGSTLKPLKDGSMLNTETYKKLSDEATLLKDKFLKTWLEVIQTLEKKAKLLTEESKLIEKEEKQVKEVSKDLQAWTKHVESSANALKGYLRGLVDIKRAIIESIDAAEQFKNANFRLYGSQTELVGRSNELAASLGIMRGKAREAMHELGNLKVPIEMMNQLTEATVKFNRFSEVSVKQTAQWQKTALSMGQSAAELERKMLHMSVAMRRFGLDTNDTTNVMRTQQEQAAYLAGTFGGEVASEIQKTQVALAAFAKEIGGTPELVNQLQSSLGSIEFWRLNVIGNYAGVAASEMQTAEGQAKAMAIGISKLAEEYKKASTPSERFAIQQKATGIYGEKLGKSMFDAGVVMANNNKITTDAVSAQELMTKALAGHIGGVDDLNSIYSESNATITQQFGLLKNAFFAAIGAIWSKIEPFVIGVLQAINWVIGGIAAVIGKISAFLGALGPVGNTIKYITIALIVAAAAFAVLVVGMSLFISASAIAAGIGRIFQAVIVRIFSALAAGLQQIAAYTGTMLALAALITSVGLSAFLLAMAVKILAEQGWRGAVAMVGLGVAFLFVGNALLTMGAVANTMKGGLLVLAIAFVAVGFSAYLFALAVSMIADRGWPAIGAMAGLTIALIILGAAIVGLGFLAMKAMPGIAVLAFALIALGVTAVLVAAATFIFATAVAMVASFGYQGALATLALAAAMAIMVGVLAYVAVVAAPAIPAMYALAGVFLILAVAAVILGVAIALVGVTFLMIGTSAKMFAQAVKTIAEVGEQGIAALGALTAALVFLIFTIAAVAVAVGPAIPLMLGLGLALMMIGAAAALVGLGIYLIGLTVKNLAEHGGEAALSLVKLSFAMFAIIPALFALGMVGMAAGPGLIMLGAALVVVGVGALMVAGAMKIAASALTEMSKISKDQVGVLLELIPVIALFGITIIALSVAALVALPGLLALAAAAIAVGIGLIAAGAGAYMFGLGMKMMVEASKQMSFGMSARMTAYAAAMAASGVILAAAAGPLVAAGFSLAIAGVMFSFGMKMMHEGAVLLEVIGPILLEHGGEFLAGVLMLVPAGMALLPAALMLMIGGAMMIGAMITLMIAGIMLSAMSGPILKGAQKLLAAGQNFQIIGDGFMAAGIGMTQGGAMIRGSIGELRSMGRELSAAGPELEAASWGLARAMWGLRFALSQPMGGFIVNFADTIQTASKAMYEVLDMVLARLEDYGIRIGAQGSSLAMIFKRLIPSLSLKELGFSSRAESVASTPSKDSSEIFLERNAKAEDQKLMRANITAINGLHTKFDDLILAVKNVAGGGETGGKLDTIITALNTYLPAIADNTASSGSGMGTAMNEWMS